MFSPKPNIPTEFFHALGFVSAVDRGGRRRLLEPYASQTSSTGTPLTLAMTWATCEIVHDSLRPLTIVSASHFSFFTARGNGGAWARCAADACEGRISHWILSAFHSSSSFHLPSP